MASKRQQSSAPGRCPICGTKSETAYRPFCSARCRDVDLGRWLGGGYAIAGGQADADEDGEEATAQRGGENMPPPGADDDAD